MLRDRLLKIITSKPDLIQFAKDRKYEKAWVIPLNKKKPTEKEINNYLNKDKFDLLIVEYIWNSKDDDNRFVLTLFLDNKCRLQNEKKFIDICLDLFYNYSDFKEFTKSIDSKVIGHPYLFLDKVDSINLSVFNYWLSVGPVELWKSGDVYSINYTIKKIKSRPEIEKTKLNYQGLLFRFNIENSLDGPYYGFKTPCCDKKGDFWIINYEKIDYWMKTIIKK